MPALRSVIDQLAAYEPSDAPVISLYLNLQADQHGKDNYDAFLRKELKARLATFDPKSEARAGLERDVERITAHLQNVEAQANGLALFACDARQLFEAVQLDVPIAGHRLYIDREPHLYPLARLDDQYPRYAALLIDTHSARLFVVSAGSVERTEEVEGTKTRRTTQGGWSQARYQRHNENIHLHNVKEAVDVLARVVRDEDIAHIVLAGDEVVMPKVREQLTPELAAKVIDITRLDQRAPEHEVVATTLDTLREHDATSDRERVQRLLDAYRGNGLAVVGAEATAAALALGQVDELIISAHLDQPEGTQGLPDMAHDSPMAGEAGQVGSVGDAVANTQGRAPAAALAEAGAEPLAEAAASVHPVEQMAESLVTKAAQTAARVTFVEDHALLAEVGGVGALLRFKL
jgi:peptide chain release factor subunit 1